MQIYFIYAFLLSKSHQNKDQFLETFLRSAVKLVVHPGYEWAHDK